MLRAAEEAGVRRMVVVGYDFASSHQAMELAAADGRMAASAGIHPHASAEWSEGAALELAEIARRGAVAIGEIGLDFYRDIVPRELQERAFVEQMELALALELPVIVHTRDSVAEAIHLARPYAQRGLRGVFHCWSGTSEQAQEIAKLGWFIGVGGVVTYKNAPLLHETVRSAPLESLLLETDAPYLPPQGHRGGRNEPAYLPLIAARAAEWREVGMDELAEACTRNAERLFGSQLCSPDEPDEEEDSR